MDDFDLIRKRLRKAAGDKKEQVRLIELFDSACTGLEVGMSRRAKDGLDDRLDSLLDEIREKAKTIQKMIKE